MVIEKDKSGLPQVIATMSLGKLLALKNALLKLRDTSGISPVQYDILVAIARYLEKNENFS